MDPSGMTMADDLLADLPGHETRADRDIARGGLRRRDDDDLGAGEEVTGGDRDVARARRHVEQENVEVAEEDVGEELLQGAVQHRPPPHDGARVRAVGLLQEHADRDRLHVVGDRRQDHVAHLRGLGRLAVLDEPQKLWDREAVHVRIDEADLEAAPREGNGQVRGERRLADPALAARDGDDTGQRVLAERVALRRPPKLLRERLTLGGRHDADVDGHGTPLGGALGGGPHVRLDAGRGGTAHDREGDAHRDGVAAYGDAAHHVELRERSAQLGVGHAADSIGDALNDRIAHRGSSSLCVAGGGTALVRRSRRAARG
jgi:hypothetical protein